MNATLKLERYCMHCSPTSFCIVTCIALLRSCIPGGTPIKQKYIKNDLSSTNGFVPIKILIRVL